jgi:excisionase family DNA binding protein
MNINSFLPFLCLVPLLFGALITTKEAAKILGVDPHQISRLVRNGKLPAQKIGRDWLIEEKDVQYYVENRPKPGPVPGKKNE